MLDRRNNFIFHVYAPIFHQNGTIVSRETPYKFLGTIPSNLSHFVDSSLFAPHSVLIFCMCSWNSLKYLALGSDVLFPNRCTSRINSSWYRAPKTIRTPKVLSVTGADRAKPCAAARFQKARVIVQPGRETRSRTVRDVIHNERTNILFYVTVKYSATKCRCLDLFKRAKIACPFEAHTRGPDRIKPRAHLEKHFTM